MTNQQSNKRRRHSGRDNRGDEHPHGLQGDAKESAHEQYRPGGGEWQDCFSDSPTVHELTIDRLAPSLNRGSRLRRHSGTLAQAVFVSPVGMLVRD